MKKLYFILLLLGMSIATFATNSFTQQGPCMSHKEFMEKKKDFLISKANLTQQEADAFFPIYMELNRAKRKLNNEVWELTKKAKDTELSEAEYGKIALKIYDLRIAVAELDKTYYEKFKKVLSNKKIFMIQQAELRFHKRLIHGFKKGKGTCPDAN